MRPRQHLASAGGLCSVRGGLVRVKGPRGTCRELEELGKLGELPVPRRELPLPPCELTSTPGLLLGDKRI